MSTPAITSDLSQPGAQAAPQQVPTQAPAPGPHSRLMSMIQGLAVGVGAFAESAATQGRSGGPEEVQRFQAEQQREQAVAQQSQQSAQHAKQEQQEGDLRMQAMRGQMSIGTFQLEQMRLNAPLDIQKKQNEIADHQMEFMDKLSKATGLPLMVVQSLANDDTKSTLGAVNDTATKNGTTIHDSMWAHVQNDHGAGNGSKIVGLDLAKFGNKIIPPDLASAATLPTKTQIDVGAGVLGEDDPSIKAGRQAFQMLQQGLASGLVSVQDYALLANRITAPITSAMGVKHATLASQKDQAETTKAQQDALNAAPDAQVTLARRKAQAEQSVKDGDPNAAADLLGKGLVAPSELISARNPAFAQKALSAAATKYPEWNAQKAEADFHIAKSEDNTKFFGAANSLLGKGGVGGNLDLLADKYKTLKNGSIPLFNKMADYTKAAAGDPALSGFVQAVIGVADDYAKVMGGGVGTDAARLQLLQAFSNAKNPAQMRNSIRTAKQALSSQAEARIGNNPVLKQMYGGATMPPAPKDATGIAPGSDGKDHYHDAKGQDLGIAP